jgi:hypothetical protein
MTHRLKCAALQVFRVNSETLWYNRNKEEVNTSTTKNIVRP